MGCGCGGKKAVWVVTKTDGSSEEVNSLTSAMSLVRKNPGAKYQRKSK